MIALESAFGGLSPSSGTKGLIERLLDTLKPWAGAADIPDDISLRRTAKEIMLNKKLLPLLGALAALVAGCTSTSAAFVKHSPDMSVVRGKILHVEDLHSQEFKRLADGIAFTVGAQGCNVKIRLSKKNEQVYHVEQGAVVVFGKSTDYIMRDASNYMLHEQSNGSTTF